MFEGNLIEILFEISSLFVSMGVVGYALFRYTFFFINEVIVNHKEETK